MHQHERKPDQHAIHRRAEEQAVDVQAVRPIESLQRTVGNRATERLLRSGAIPATGSPGRVQRHQSAVVEQEGLQGVSRQGHGVGGLIGQLIRWVEASGGPSGVLGGVGESVSEGAGNMLSDLQGGGIGGALAGLVRRGMGEQSPDEENQ